MGRKVIRVLPVLGAGLLTLAAIAATLHPPDAGASATRPVPEMLRASFRLTSGDAVAAASRAASRTRPAAAAATPEG